MKKLLKNAVTGLFQLMILGVCFSTVARAQIAPASDPQVKAITAAMQKSAAEWNKGNLKAFMEMYDGSATMMMPTGDVGIDAIRNLYQTKYFNGGMPKQNLRYGDLKVRFLGKDYALLTGSFTLYGNHLAERSGRYSLVLVRNKNGWKILHDHSS